MTVFTIDVSHWDRDRRGAPLDWDTIASQGIAAACVRATYGDPDTYFPPTRYFREMATGAAAEGFLVGGYHNLIHGDDASINRQVDVLGAELDTVGATFGMLDVEPYTALQTNGLWPRWADVVRFRDRWTLVGGDRPLLFYIPRWVWSDWLQLADLSILGGPVVAAAYPAGDAQDTPGALYERVGGNNGAGWRTYGGVLPALWQFTSSARVDGASEHTDINAYRGSRAQLAAMLGGAPMALPANWRVVESIKTFERQCRPLAPNAPATSFGTVADSSHSTTSDHYPHQVAALGSQPVVTAGDIPLAEQLDPRAVLDSIRRSRDNRVKYGISRGQMFSSYATSSYPAWTWRPYGGLDGHFDHGHLSVLDAAIADDPRAWDIGAKGDEKMQYLVRDGNGTVWSSDLATRWVVTDPSMVERIQIRTREGRMTYYAGGAVQNEGSGIVDYGVPIQDMGDPAVIQRMAEAVAAAVEADDGNSFTPGDHDYLVPLIADGVKQALREGTG